MDKLKQIIDILESMSDSELIGLWNEYCNECNYTDDCIYSTNDFDELTDFEYLIRDRHYTASDIVTRIKIDFSKFDVNDNYYYINGYGHYISFNSLEYAAEGCPFMTDVLAKAILDGDVDVSGYDDLAELMSDNTDTED